MTRLTPWGGLFYFAQKEALKSDFPNYKIGCIVMHKGKIVAKGFNKNKSHPKLNKYGYWNTTHSECASILKANKGDTLVIVRVRKDGNFSCCKPCIRCLKFAKDFGINKIFYSDWAGDLREITI